MSTDCVGHAERAWVSTRACPVCSANQASWLHDSSYALFDDSELPTETAIVACRRCGMHYADSQATAASYRAHYARHSKYDTAVAASGSGVSATDAVRLDATVERVLPHVKAGARILDVGAGRGGLLLAFARRGYASIVGIDPAPGCVDAMRAQGITAEVGELEDAIWKTDPQRFDLVLLSHVVEHVFDAAAVLGHVAARVAAGGRIYIEVPDAARYTLADFPPYYFLDPEHINHFDGETLAALAQRCGWHVEARWHDHIVVASGARYPIVAVVLTRERVTQVAAGVRNPAIERYLAASRNAVAASASTARIEALAASGRRLVLWGAGSHAQRLLAQTALAHCPIDCIIDGDVGKQGRPLRGIAVVAPDDGLARAVALDADVALAIAVGADEVAERVHASHPGLRVHLL